jgi:tRNA threonylcarbamoyl adenosine modification protein YeaZ
MKILALEFSSPLRSVCVAGDVPKPGYAEERGPAKSSRPFALIEGALREAGIERQELNCIAVGLGPGSYAGIRSAIAIAQGWQIAQGVKLLAVRSADAVAAELALQRDGVVEVAAEALRGEWFSAAYELADKQARLLRDFAPLSPTRMAELTEAGCLVRMSAFGDCAVHYPTAKRIATLANSRKDFVSGAELTPLALRNLEFVKAAPARFSVPLPG